ncbi:FUSC family protein [Jongsikchunia kroppenstedtii]|uniref:FUSC family protein n=1 Tax=Jongsikchunia kroppenstedtii TaxID=1121721 RepID=UPI00039C9EF8|nr:FUSC family protein [Jongsikchunia kroppenstedtii]
MDRGNRARPALRPDGQDHFHALRVAVGLLAPATVLLTTGRPELMIFAVFGAFAGMYGRGETARLRRRHQMQAAVLLTVGVAVGVSLSNLAVPTWVLVVVEIGFAMAGSVVADACGLRPAGPFFFLFALGATAVVPAGVVDPVVALAICAATAALAVVIGAVGVPGSRDDRPASCGVPPGAWVHATRYGIAIAAAGGVGVFLGFAHANWAMASAAVPLAVIGIGGPAAGEIRPVLSRAGHRVAGTCAGLVLTAAVLAADLPPWALAALMVALLFPTELFMARHYAVAIGFFTPLIMLMCELADPADPMQLVGYRGLDTLIGVAAGVVVAVLVRGRGCSSAAAETAADGAARVGCHAGRSVRS